MNMQIDKHRNNYSTSNQMVFFENRLSNSRNATIVSKSFKSKSTKKVLLNQEESENDTSGNRNDGNYSDDQRLVVIFNGKEALKSKIEDEMDGCCCLYLDVRGSGKSSVEDSVVRLFTWVCAVIEEEIGEETLVQIVSHDSEGEILISELSDLLRESQIDTSECVIQLIEIPETDSDEEVVEKLKECGLRPIRQHVRYSS